MMNEPGSSTAKTRDRGHMLVCCIFGVMLSIGLIGCSGEKKVPPEEQYENTDPSPPKPIE